MADNKQQTLSQDRGVKVTVSVVVLFILAVVAMFVYRIQQPRIMTVAEMKLNGAYMLDTPRKIGEINLIDQSGGPFTMNACKAPGRLFFLVLPTALIYAQQPWRFSVN